MNADSIFGIMGYGGWKAARMRNLKVDRIGVSGSLAKGQVRAVSAAPSHHFPSLGPMASNQSAKFCETTQFESSFTGCESSTWGIPAQEFGVKMGAKK